MKGQERVGAIDPRTWDLDQSLRRKLRPRDLRRSRPGVLVREGAKDAYRVPYNPQAPMQNNPPSIWEQSQRAGDMLERYAAAGVEAPLAAVAEHFGWSVPVTRSRLRIYRQITAHVVELAGASEEAMRSLPLARLLDAARRQSERERAITLSYALFSRRPAWADSLVSFGVTITPATVEVHP